MPRIMIIYLARRSVHMYRLLMHSTLTRGLTQNSFRPPDRHGEPVVLRVAGRADHGGRPHDGRRPAHHHRPHHPQRRRQDQHRPHGGAISSTLGMNEIRQTLLPTLSFVSGLCKHQPSDSSLRHAGRRLGARQKSH